MKTAYTQQGLILSLMVFWLFLISLVLLLSLRPTTAQLAWQAQNQQISHLAWTHEQLWQFSQQTPQLYATDTNGHFYDADRIPSPGYFPCPDTSNNGQSNAPCGQGHAIAIGRLPKNIATRSINFTPYHATKLSLGYAVDSRYVIQNADYHNPPIQRFAPLNSVYPGEAALQSFRGQASVVVLFLIPVDETYNPADWRHALMQAPDHPDRHAFNQRFPVQQALTLQQWQQRMQDQVAPLASKLCPLAPDQPHWFNACSNPQQPTANCPDQQPANPTGSNWRALVC
jgi:hypothetical protein